MLRYVGDLAWCYTTGGPGSAYAPISQTQFDAFQRAIGKFTAVVADSHGTVRTPFAQGEEVMVIGGSFKDQRGRIMKIEGEDPDGIIRYLISIVNDLTTSFTATLDSRLLRPAKQA